METAGVYKITHRPTGLVYVGSSIQLAVRARTHFRALKQGRHCNYVLQAAWNKAKGADFAYEVLCHCEPTREALEKHEQFYIDLYQAATRGKGYNLAPRAGNMAGVVRTPEAAARLKEQRELFGPRPVSILTRLRQSHAQKKQALVRYNRRREPVEVYPSSKEAARHMQSTREALFKACRQGHMVGGCYWGREGQALVVPVKPAPAPIDEAAVARVLAYRELPFFQR